MSTSTKASFHWDDPLRLNLQLSNEERHGLTEPNRGSDPGSMITRATKVDGGYKISCFVLEKGWKGLSAPVIHGIAAF